MEIGPRVRMVWTREINGKRFRFTRTENREHWGRSITIKCEEWEPFYGVWKGEFQSTYRHQLRFSQRAGEQP